MAAAAPVTMNRAALQLELNGVGKTSWQKLELLNEQLALPNHEVTVNDINTVTNLLAGVAIAAGLAGANNRENLLCYAILPLGNVVQPFHVLGASNNPTSQLTAACLKAATQFAEADAELYRLEALTPPAAAAATPEEKKAAARKVLTAIKGVEKAYLANGGWTSTYVTQEKTRMENTYFPQETAIMQSITAPAVEPYQALAALNTALAGANAQYVTQEHVAAVLDRIRGYGVAPAPAGDPQHKKVYDAVRPVLEASLKNLGAIEASPEIREKQAKILTKARELMDKILHANDDIAKTFAERTKAAQEALALIEEMRKLSGNRGFIAEVKAVVDGLQKSQKTMLTDQATAARAQVTGLQTALDTASRDLVAANTTLGNATRDHDAAVAAQTAAVGRKTRADAAVDRLAGVAAVGGAAAVPGEVAEAQAVLGAAQAELDAANQALVDARQAVIDRTNERAALIQPLADAQNAATAEVGARVTAQGRREAVLRPRVETAEAYLADGMVDNPLHAALLAADENLSRDADDNPQFDEDSDEKAAYDAAMDAFAAQVAAANVAADLAINLIHAKVAADELDPARPETYVANATEVVRLIEAGQVAARLVVDAADTELDTAIEALRALEANSPLLNGIYDPLNPPALANIDPGNAQAALIIIARERVKAALVARTAAGKEINALNAALTDARQELTHAQTFAEAKTALDNAEYAVINATAAVAAGSLLVLNQEAKQTARGNAQLALAGKQQELVDARAERVDANAAVLAANTEVNRTDGIKTNAETTVDAAVAVKVRAETRLDAATAAERAIKLGLAAAEAELDYAGYPRVVAAAKALVLAADAARLAQRAVVRNPDNVVTKTAVQKAENTLFKAYRHFEATKTLTDKERAIHARVELGRLMMAWTADLIANSPQDYERFKAKLKLRLAMVGPAKKAEVDKAIAELDAATTPEARKAAMKTALLLDAEHASDVKKRPVESIKEWIAGGAKKKGDPEASIKAELIKIAALRHATGQNPPYVIRILNDRKEEFYVVKEVRVDKKDVKILKQPLVSAVEAKIAAQDWAGLYALLEEAAKEPGYVNSAQALAVYKRISEDDAAAAATVVVAAGGNSLLKLAESHVQRPDLISAPEPTGSDTLAVHISFDLIRAATLKNACNADSQYKAALAKLELALENPSEDPQAVREALAEIDRLVEASSTPLVYESGVEITPAGAGGPATHVKFTVDVEEKGKMTLTTQGVKEEQATKITFSADKVDGQSTKVTLTGPAKERAAGIQVAAELAANATPGRVPHFVLGASKEAKGVFLDKHTDKKVIEKDLVSINAGVKGGACIVRQCHHDKKPETALFNTYRDLVKQADAGADAYRDLAFKDLELRSKLIQGMFLEANATDATGAFCIMGDPNNTGTEAIFKLSIDAKGVASVTTDAVPPVVVSDADVKKLLEAQAKKSTQELKAQKEVILPPAAKSTTILTRLGFGG